MSSDDLVAAARDAERYCRTFIEGTFDRTQEARARMALDDLRAALTATPEPGLPLDRCGEPTCVHGVHEDMTCSACGRFPLAAKPEPGLDADRLRVALDNAPATDARSYVRGDGASPQFAEAVAAEYARLSDEGAEG